MTQETKKVLSGLVAISLVTGGFLYQDKARKKEVTIDETFKSVMDTFKNDTELDEAEAIDMATYKDMSITEAADYLEESIDIVEILSSYDFSEVDSLDPLTDEEYTFAENLTKEDVILITTVLDAKEESDSLEYEEAKIKSIKMLSHIKNIREKWIADHGRKVVLDTLDWVVKGSVAEDLNIPVEEINKVEFPSSKKITDLKFYVIYDNNNYYLKGDSNLFGALYYRYQIKSTNDFGGQEYDIYKDALNSAKIVIMTGVDTENYKFSNERSLKEAKKVLKRE